MDDRASDNHAGVSLHDPKGRADTGQLNIRSPCWSTIWRALASENSTASS